ncbi:MAG: hypothetical protein N2246_08645, partial [Candidatus Sumerlaeia bacterium]|nr:hypothetical protein [Candidatus Sumerlaeia bacterium]
VLFNDVKSGERRKIENAVYSFIGIGREEIIDELVKILETSGNKEMAETYLNCGHSRLEEAGEIWARRHGYFIMFGSGSCAALWGMW